MLIYPAIDLQNGKCVRLRQGRAEDSTTFGDNPEKVAVRWQEQGAEFLHVVDLDGAFEGLPRNLNAISRILDSVELPIQVGGGVRTDRAVNELIQKGVSRLIVGTAALQDPDWFTELVNQYQGQIAVGVDAKDGQVAVKGWTEVSDIPILDFLSRIDDLPLTALIYTDIHRDGMMSGPNFDSILEVAEKSSIPVIASGGITTIEDVRRLSDMPLNGMIIGRAIYEGTIQLSDALEVVQ